MIGKIVASRQEPNVTKFYHNQDDYNAQLPYKTEVIGTRYVITIQRYSDNQTKEFIVGADLAALLNAEIVSKEHAIVETVSWMDRYYAINLDTTGTNNFSVAVALYDWL